MLTSQESSVEDDRRPDQAGARPQDRRGRGVLHELQHRLLEGKVDTRPQDRQGVLHILQHQLLEGKEGPRLPEGPVYDTSSSSFEAKKTINI